VHPADIVIGDHYTSTAVGSHFTTGLMVTKHLPGRHVAVTHESVTIRTPGAPTEHRPLREGELAEWLTTLEVPLTPDERARLLDRVALIPSPG
jgi:N-hydroxyarylamine O-acetyltransferase